MYRKPPGCVMKYHATNKPSGIWVKYIDSLKRIREGLEIALNNLPAEEVHYLSEPIFSLGITPSIRSHLEAHGILYIGDLIHLDESYLMEIWGVGPVTLEKIKSKLNENGVWFGMDVIRVGNHWYRRKQELKQTDSMEESKELQGFYRIFRAVVYVSVLMEFFEYAIDPAMLDHWGGILCDIHGRIKRWAIYNDGNLVYSKVATVLLICITCIGTRAKKHLEFNARRQVLYPLVSGFALLVLSVWLFGHPMETRFYTLPLNIILYMAVSLTGGYPRHVALDNISKFLKEGLMKDRFNFEE